MKKSTLKPFMLVSLMLISIGMSAQKALWTKVSTKETQSQEKTFRKTMPTEFDLFKLNTSALKALLAQAPERLTTTSNVIIELPTNNGDIQRFRVYEASNFAPELQAKHPNTRSYMAQGIEDGSAVARFSVSDNVGVHIMISSVHYSTIYIDPYTKDNKNYISYNTIKLPASEGFECSVENPIGPEPPLEYNRNANDGQLRTFRLALACTGEYALYHLAQQGVGSGEPDPVKIAAVLSAMNVALTRLNGVYERDLSLTMVLVPNNEEVIFLNPATDPYTNNNGQVMLSQNQQTCDAKIGDANYDIGHVFSTGGGGIAQLRSPCVKFSKAKGVTGLPAPLGDKFFIDFVAHEMGHQYGANHTFNNACGGNRNNATAHETGSGSTILSYAGVCAPNVQSFSDDYFHAISLQEIWNNIKAGSGKCAAQTPTGNLPPTADAGGNYTIPKSTAFRLKGTATDPDSGDVLSHCWEQMNPQIGTPQPPKNTNTQGPMFRTIKPLPTDYRYMPAINTVLAGKTESLWEVVPSVARTLNFRYTVRDNAAAGGSTASSDMFVIVDPVSGPFEITSQNTATTWTIGNTENVTWDVAGTDGGVVNSPNVDILFSTDGGQTYPVAVVLNVPNNGSAVVNVPNINTTTGRMMIISSNNIFFDVNNANITVTGTVGVEDFVFNNFGIYPNPSKGVFNIEFTPASQDKVQLNLYDLRGRLINQVEYDDVSTNGMFKQQLDYSYLNSGMYFLVVKNGDKTATKKLIKE